MFFFSEINENFVVNPIDKDVRRTLLNTLQQILLELNLLIDNKSLNEIQELPKASIINNISSEHLNKVNKVSCGWVDLDVYDKEFLDKGINNIAQANLNILWIRFLPELYLSKNAIFADKKQQFLEQINVFTKALKEKYKSLNKPLPKIFIGLEMTGNYKNKVVNEYIKDIYGHSYTKIPTPFNFDEFWKTELLDVFDEFYNQWQTIANGLPIDGIFLDFEMYHAQDQTAEFPATCDFSNSAWNLYLEKTNQNIELFNTKNRINCLYKEKKLNQYFEVLKNEAYNLGKKIKEHIKAKSPDIVIGAYMPNLPSEWFYLGVIAGLSSKEEPIIFATFNNEFYAHKQWLEQNKIYCSHITAILLSKFNNQESFKLIKYLNQDHDGVWFNRFSRLGQKYEENKWWSNESTSFDHDLIIKEIKNI